MQECGTIDHNNSRDPPQNAVTLVRALRSRDDLSCKSCFFFLCHRNTELLFTKLRMHGGGVFMCRVLIHSPGSRLSRKHGRACAAGCKRRRRVDVITIFITMRMQEKAPKGNGTGQRGGAHCRPLAVGRKRGWGEKAKRKARFECKWSPSVAECSPGCGVHMHLLHTVRSRSLLPPACSVSQPKAQALLAALTYPVRDARSVQAAAAPAARAVLQRRSEADTSR